MVGLLGKLFMLNQVQSFFGVPHQSGRRLICKILQVFSTF